jgi:hypothetical protein
MSSESISPSSFYERLGFGYNRFTKVEPNNLENRIVLYAKYPVFDIPDQDLEKYPLVVEIDTKFLNEDVVQEQNGSFFAEKTIYLNPFTTKFYFQNEQEKISTLSKAEPFTETKMVALYNNCFAIKSHDVESIRLGKVEIDDSLDDSSLYISKDRKINKLKGLLYAYLLGANKSVSADVLALKKSAKDLRNVLSAIITSPDGQANYNQKRQTDELYQTINNAFFNAEGLKDKLQNIIQEKQQKYHCENFVEILQDENLYNIWFSNQGILPSFQLSPFSIRIDSNEKKQEAIDAYFINLERAINRISTSKNIKIEDLPSFQHCSVINTIPTQKEFLSKLLMEYLQEAYNSDDFIQSRYEFAKSGGKIFREELGEKWEGSSSKQYINGLLKNLNEYTAFDIKCEDNITLQSFAAFCQKADDDIDKLEDYLISNEIGDFRIAFSLWGIVFGFANMPKTLTNDLFLSDDLDYVSEVYKYIFKQVHGIELEGKFEEQQQKEVDTSQSEIQKEEESLQKTTVRTDVGGSDIINKLKDCKLKPEQLEIVSEIYKTNNCKTDDKFFSKVGNVKGIGVKKLEKIKECLGFKTNEASSQMFSHDSSGLFLKDFNFLSHNEKFINIVSKHKDWKDDLKWFIESHGKTHKDFKYWKNKPTDNESVIKQFIFFKKEIYKETEELLKSLYLQNER